MLALRSDIDAVVRSGCRVTGSVGRSGCETCDVRRHTVCASLELDELPRLEAISIQRRLAAGQVLFHEGDPSVDVFNITQGMIKLYKLLSDGRCQITGFLSLVTFLGLLAQTHKATRLKPWSRPPSVVSCKVVL